MSKKADDNWGAAWSREMEMECRIALQHLAACVWAKWEKAFSAEKYPDMVGLGQVHDIWNMMYQDMKALYTLERLVNGDYAALIVEKDGPGMINQVGKESRKTTGTASNGGDRHVRSDRDAGPTGEA